VREGQFVPSGATTFFACHGRKTTLPANSVDDGKGGRGLEICDGRGRRFSSCLFFFLIGLVVDLGKRFGGDAGAAAIEPICA